ncbi:hypothetical protein ZWY2020_024718 [Hordeum vulgare]|nr:hypothetical protein ZWY2020_024718 [Hordeum vulgare]
MTLASPSAPRHRAASTLSGGISEEDTFTRCSGYLFEEGLATEGDLLTAYDIPSNARVYGRRPLLVLRRSLQIETSFGRWFAPCYLDSLNERAADMFEIRAAQLRRILLELCPFAAAVYFWWCRLAVKKSKAEKDPNKPKRPPSAFFVFM